MNPIFSVSSLDTTIQQDDEQIKLRLVEFHDLVRGFCGALFFAIPLHYTMEMWDRARVIPCPEMILILVGAYFANVAYCIFSNFKPDQSRRAAWFDALESLGIGIVASTITMTMIDQLGPEIPWEVYLKVIALETVPTSFGASLAKNQLGGGSKKGKAISEQYSPDTRKILGASLGALLFAFNIAPTMEPIVISSSIQWFQLIGIVVFSLVVSYMMNFIAGFTSGDDQKGGIMGAKWAETVVAYAISLVVSAFLLWMFGYLNADTSLGTAIPWIVVLGYVTTLGSSAGRIIL